MNILTITGSYYPQTGGVPKVVKEVSEGLVKKGHGCTVLAINSAYSGEEYVNGVRVIRSRMRKYLYRFNPALYQYLKKDKNILNSVDVVHVHAYSNPNSLMAVHLVRNEPIVFNPHYHERGHTMFANFLHKLYKPIGKNMFKRVDKVVCVSEYESSLIQKDFRISTKDIQVIPNGVKQINSSIKKKNEGNVILLLYVGYVRRYKGIQYILRAMKKLEKKHDKKSILTIIGTGDYEIELKKLAKNLNLEGCVFCL